MTLDQARLILIREIVSERLVNFAIEGPITTRGGLVAQRYVIDVLVDVPLDKE